MNSNQINYSRKIKLLENFSILIYFTLLIFSKLINPLKKVIVKIKNNNSMEILNLTLLYSQHRVCSIIGSASDYDSGGCSFEYCQARIFLFSKLIIFY